MPIIKSAIKRARQAEKRRSRNLVVKRAVTKDVKAVITELEAGDAKATAVAFRSAQSEIDRAVKKGAMHANAGARKKSRLNALIKRTLGEAATMESKPVAKTKAKPTAKKSPVKKSSAKSTK